MTGASVYRPRSATSSDATIVRGVAGTTIGEPYRRTARRAIHRLLPGARVDGVDRPGLGRLDRQRGAVVHAPVAGDPDPDQHHGHDVPDEHDRYEGEEGTGLPSGTGRSPAARGA